MNTDEPTRQEQLKEFLTRYKLEQYFNVLVEEGFDRLLSLFDITESDLIALNVKRGHRRLLQRAIATSRGVPISTPILINYGYDEPGTSHMPKPGTVTTTTTTFIPDTANNTIGITRRSPNTYYSNHHVHKKRKQHVPSKPITAFDEFLNELKLDLHGLSLPEITAMAHDRWNLLSPSEKEKYEREALHANSNYVMEDTSTDQGHHHPIIGISLPSRYHPIENVIPHYDTSIAPLPDIYYSNTHSSSE